MKKIFFFSLAVVLAGILWGCKKEGNYPGGTVSSYISIFDLRNIYKGSDVTLSTDNMFGASKIAAIVVSDHSGNNLPEDMLVVEDARRLGQLRGIVIPLEPALAQSFVPGDSLVIKVEGKILKKVDGVLELTGVTSDDISKVATGLEVTPKIVKSNNILETPDAYEGALVTVTRATFDPTYPPFSTYEGNRTISDGFGDLILHTEATASFAGDTLPFLSNFTGIVLNDVNGNPQLWPRKDSDIKVLSATAPKIAPVVVTGFLADPTGTDGNYEYIQLMATRDIDFSVKNISVVTTNNAGASQPTGYPVAGWATGGTKTYKFDITSGTVVKGQYFYIGANKNIWGAGSTDISSSLWYSKMYVTEDGDLFGTHTTNLLANSGNAAGIAIFDKTNVTETDEPVDVIFYGGNGQLYTPGPPEKGYRITNTDYYDTKNPSTLESQPFFAMGSNTGKFPFPTAAHFARLGGVYNTSTGRWSTARIEESVTLTTTSTVAEIEGATTVED